MTRRAAPTASALGRGTGATRRERVAKLGAASQKPHLIRRDQRRDKRPFVVSE
jgi:hypothetical protein